ncbi:MAG TPA: EpsD family peptidyl-prolyl cis-trans isomerase [Rubrivivax sp.]|nr:EpsD family peptidyl-prolyl cis-trans isomerase [Rubrivivax sp.]
MNIQPSTYHRTALILSAALIGAAMLTACGDSKTPAVTQVAARVNKSEISVHQVNYALQRVPGGAANASDATTREVLDRLVSQQLVVDRAAELELDLVPEVQQALQEARRNVLSRAYVDHLAAGATQPSPEQVAAFYDQRPELFAQRRNYTIQEVDIEGSDAALDVLKKRLGEGPLPGFAEQLKSSGLRYKTRLLNEPSENLSMDLMARLASIKEGQSIYLTHPGGMRVLVLVSAQPAAVTLSEATPAIKRYLVNDSIRKTVDSDLEAMRGAAKLEYMGRFAPLMAASAAASGAASGSPADSLIAPAEESRAAPETKPGTK